MENLINEKYKKMQNNQEETDDEIQKFDRVSININNNYNINNIIIE